MGIHYYEKKSLLYVEPHKGLICGHPWNAAVLFVIMREKKFIICGAIQVANLPMAKETLDEPLVWLHI